MEEGRNGRRRDFWTVLDAGYEDAKIIMADGRIPCAVAVMTKKPSSRRNGDFREESIVISPEGQIEVAVKSSGSQWARYFTVRQDSIWRGYVQDL